MNYRRLALQRMSGGSGMDPDYERWLRRRGFVTQLPPNYDERSGGRFLREGPVDDIPWRGQMAVYDRIPGMTKPTTYGGRYNRRTSGELRTLGPRGGAPLFGRGPRVLAPLTRQVPMSFDPVSGHTTYGQVF